MMQQRILTAMDNKDINDLVSDMETPQIDLTDVLDANGGDSKIEKIEKK